MIRQYKVRYKQEFCGKVLEDSYDRYLDDTESVSDIYSALYEDPCVFFVDVKEIPAQLPEVQE